MFGAAPVQDPSTLKDWFFSLSQFMLLTNWELRSLREIKISQWSPLQLPAWRQQLADVMWICWWRRHEPGTYGQKCKQIIIIFSFYFHATDQTRAEINRNSFPAHFICDILMGLEVNISVQGTDRETDTSRTTLDDQNPEILQITAIWILY